MGGSQTGRKRKKAPTVAKLKKTAWKLLSELVRRSNPRVCYTCGEPAHSWKQLQAGHAIPGRTGMTLLDEEIIRPQDARCNIWGSGQHHIFAAKLIKENGMDWWEKKLQDSRQIKKWSRSDLLSKIEEYRGRLKALG